MVLAADHDPKQRHVLRLAPAPTERPGKTRRLRPTVITLAPSEAGGAALDIVDPYPDDGLAVVDPYGSAPGNTVKAAGGASAPAAGVRSVRAPGPSAIGVPPVASPPDRAAAPDKAAGPDKAAAPGPRAKPAPRAAARRVERTVEITRAELNAALSDFDALGREIQVERADGGGVRVVGLSRGSFFHRTGLRERDVVRSVAGVRLTTIESAAMVYARVQASDGFDVEIERGRQRVKLTYAIR